VENLTASLQSLWQAGAPVSNAAPFLTGAFVGAIIAFALIGVRTAIMRLLRPLFRLASRISRRVGLKALGRTRPARAVLSGVARDHPQHRRPEHLTALEWALQQPDHGAAQQSPDSAPAPLHDLREEDRLLRLHRGLFDYLRVPEEYTPKSVSAPLSSEIADVYFAEAQEFFTRTVELDVDELNFYEDEEAGLIASLFLHSDRRFFYVLDRLRKVMTGNARRFVFLLAIALVITFVAAWGAFNPLPFQFPLLDQKFGVAVYILGVIGVSWFVQYAYAHRTRQNMQEFTPFLTRYFQHLAVRFMTASANASRVVQGDERDSKELAAKAQKWHQIMVWLGVRPYFLESFVRNVRFQLRRNSKLYLIGAFAAYLLVIPSVFLTVFYWLDVSGFHKFFSEEWWASLALYLVAAAICWGQVYRKVLFEELNQKNWYGFGKFEIGKQFNEVIGKYAEEIGLWRGRFHS